MFVFIREKVINIFKKIKPNKNMENVTDIVEGGYLDSFEIMSLIMALSETFDIEIGFKEIVPENFNTIDAMIAMVERLQQGEKSV